MEEETLRRQVVLIMGAGRAPGPALAAALAQQGGIVALNDLSPILLDPLAEAAQNQAGHAKIYVADAARGMPARAMLDEILEDWGRVDVLINNPRIQPETALFKMDEWDWQRTMEMNLNGPFLLMQLCARLMQEQGGGVIINIVDTNPDVLNRAGAGAYAASQAGLLALSQAAARELIAYNIRVHTLCPDDVVLRGPSVEDLADEAIKKFGDLVVYLCGPEGAHLPGQLFPEFRQE